MHLVKRDSKGEYPKKIHVSDHVKYGYSEWLGIQAIIIIITVLMHKNQSLLSS